jgi:integrase
VRVFRRGKVYYCYVYEDGVRRQRSTRCHDKAAAEIVARGFERDAADPDHARTKDATVSDAIGMLVRTREEQARAGRRSHSTVAFYRAKGGQLIRVLEGDPEAGTYRPFPLHKLRARHVDAFISTRRDEGVGEHSISKELITLRAALKIAKRAGLWRGDIGELLPVAFAPEYVPRERWVPPAEFKLLLAQLLDGQAARVAFILATSAGASEAEKMLRPDVTPATPTSGELVLLRGTKRPKRWRTVPIERAAQRELLAYALARADGEGELLFAPWTNIRRDLERACIRAGLAKVSPNDLRRSFAHWLRAELVPLEVIAPMMGHSTTKMVQLVYGKLSTAELAAQLRGHCITGASPQTAPVQLDPPDATRSGEKVPRKKAKSGAQRQNRTADTRIFNPLLYQLSYLGLSVAKRRAISSIRGDLSTLRADENRLPPFGCLH